MHAGSTTSWRGGSRRCGKRSSGHTRRPCCGTRRRRSTSVPKPMCRHGACLWRVRRACLGQAHGCRCDLRPVCDCCQAHAPSAQQQPCLLAALLPPQVACLVLATHKALLPWLRDEREVLKVRPAGGQCCASAAPPARTPNPCTIACRPCRLAHPALPALPHSRSSASTWAAAPLRCCASCWPPPSCCTGTAMPL